MKATATNSHRERAPLANETRNRRRAEHSKAVIADLCEIVTDLFVAESKLLNPSNYGVQPSVRREEVLQSVEEFVSALPPRYALGADTPSEVLVHMRLMAAVRSDHTRAVVHIVNLEDGSASTTRPNRARRLVTICCEDATGLLEYISRLLATGGSRVLDADVMISTDGIILVSYGKYEKRHHFLSTLSCSHSSSYTIFDCSIFQDRFIVEMHGRLRLDK